MEDLVPVEVVKAAKRAFIRTTAQAYAASMPTGGVSAAAIVAFVEGPNWLLAAATLGVALVTPVFAGAAAYLDIIGNGIPEDYQA